MPKFDAHISRMQSATITVEADDDEAAEAKVQEMLNSLPKPQIDWEIMRKSVVIDEVVEA